jgi:hypothetical protein
MAELGPVYNVELIERLPLHGSCFFQAMPNRRDLIQVQQVNERAAAGYEVLLSHYLELKALTEKLQKQVDSGRDALSSVAGAIELVASAARKELGEA